MFNALTLGYLAFAFIFQFISTLFVAIDKKCKNSRVLWMAGVLLTGPVALTAYILKGRNK